ncbi:aminotransferase class I/II-fold pyridoxal phosphate-dependent enzyme [Patescibacteria group bacterium]|nr:aminotransferase class I/II-fold pyridoxal phosphate-dependent enzyme [Patescibacteria group bacterium]
MAEKEQLILKSRLPEGGTNLFQLIKAVSKEAEDKKVSLIKLSIGQPQGPALESARKAAAEAALSNNESMHEYQDNGSPGVPDFAKKFVQAHLETPLPNDSVDFLPIPGIKPMLGLIPLACGGAEKILTIATTTKPGYPTPKDWAATYLKQNVYEVPLNPENVFRFSTNDLPPQTELIMMNYPHNPTGQIATREWLEELCQYCQKNNIRLFNDAAYIALSHKPESRALTEVALNFPRLSWIEAYSASKLIGNGTGWRVGAIVGSPDFVGDIKTIKGNTDSGFVAPMAAGALYSLENDKQGIEAYRRLYEGRLGTLIKILSENGMKLAVEPKAGFFTLWKTPKMAFGEEMRDAQHFNFTMIEKTGIVGVHFNPGYIRYAVCSDVEAVADKISAAFKEAKVSY